MTGQTISHYEVVEKLGGGGMGVVYKARDLKLYRFVAFKFLPHELSTEEEVKARFTREARAASGLDHPNICTIHEIDETDDGQIFIVMAYYAGETLKKKIHRGPLPLMEALDFAIQVTQGLAKAHQGGIVHRDIKPANVMVAEGGVVKIVDFGLAQLGDGTRLTKTGGTLGTPAYMSPEQAQHLATDRRTDIWSLGVLLYEMVTGRLPFEGEREQAVVYSIVNEPYEPVTAIRAGVPLELDRILSKALAKKPEERYQHSDEVLVDLKGLRWEPKSAQHRSVPPAPDKTPGRNWWRFGAASVLGVIALVSAWEYLQSSRVTGIQFANATYTQLTSQPGQELYPSLSPDGRSLVYASPASGSWDIYFQRVGGKNPINLTKDSDFDDTQPAFSPDGERIAFRSERDGGGIFLMGATGESVRRLTDFGYNPAWSPDGNEIVCSTGMFMRPDAQISWDARLVRIKVATGDKQILDESQPNAFQPNWSPNNRRIAYWQVNGQRHQDIVTIPSGGGDPVPVTNDPAVDWNPVWSRDGRYLFYASDRSGSMNLWRVRIDEKLGEVLGQPEPITTPSPYSAYLSVSEVGVKVAYVQKVETWNLYTIGFSPSTEAPVGQPVALTQGLQQVRYPDISPDGEWVAFVSWGKREDLYVVRSNGTGLLQLTDDEYIDRGPRWSPDGKQIIFFSNRSGKSEAWTINRDGSQLRQVTDDREGPITHSIWSPDGLRTAHMRIAGPIGIKTLILDAAKPLSQQTPQMLPPWPGESGESFWVYAWSPNGKKLAGHLQRQGTRAGVLVYSLDSSKFEQVTEAGGAPRWLSDSRRILFRDRGKLYMVDSQSRRSREVLSVFPNEIEEWYGLSPDDKTICLVIVATEADIWLMTLE